LIKKKLKSFEAYKYDPTLKKITISKQKNEENYIEVFKLFNSKFLRIFNYFI